MIHAAPFQVGGYVLAGGRSSRMGTDKALLQLNGKPLIQHAVAKLRRICADVHILSSNPALAAYAPLVPDIHSYCGPIGGMEAALVHSSHDWNLFLAVDMPFLPSTYISAWVGHWIHSEDDGAGIHMFTAEGRPQPGLCLLHKNVLPFLARAIARHDFKLMRVIETAGRELALRHGSPPGAGLRANPAPSMPPVQGETTPSYGHTITKAQHAAQHLWFANLNTPRDFTEAESHVDALEADIRYPSQVDTLDT